MHDAIFVSAWPWWVAGPAIGTIVIGAAILTAALGLWRLRRSGNRTLTGAPVEVHPKPWKRGVAGGGLLLGAGWGLTGACPGTSLVQIGEGKIVALFTVAGIPAGTYVYGWPQSRSSGPTVTASVQQVRG